MASMAPAMAGAARRTAAATAASSDAIEPHQLLGRPQIEVRQLRPHLLRHQPAEISGRSFRRS